MQFENISVHCEMIKLDVQLSWRTS